METQQMDTQNNNTHYDILNKDTEHIETEHKYTQHNAALHNNTLYYDIQHNHNLQQQYSTQYKYTNQNISRFHADCSNVKLSVVIIKKTCFQNKSNFITEDHFAKHVNITIH